MVQREGKRESLGRAGIGLGCVQELSLSYMEDRNRKRTVDWVRQRIDPKFR